MRAYRHPDDLRALQGLVRRVWSPGCQYHVGDLAWQRRQHLGREGEWPTALWEQDGVVVGWGWAELPGFLNLLVDPARPNLIDAVLEWFDGVATAGPLTVVALQHDTRLVEALERHGYSRKQTEVYSQYMYRPLTGLPEPGSPPGFTVRPVSGEADAARRAAVHQAAWHPSRVTEDSYRTVMAAWPYRADLDWVVEAPDGRFASYCLIWYDGHNRAGEIEPVGTDPQFRRMGLARAACLAALRALRDLGADKAVVYPTRGHPASQGAYPLYRDLGFIPHARTHTYEKP
ncbi:Ribosomal protein S18 acetylase RimI [Thermomonospora echinospora]|uniref:Ribosomal protein S18 acetylase RimI n=2 Tax=Thermomonospora echinospora TaxID=1992 RepID=A0A1H6E231_9ACTN|nr:Ribosomal protein S18 acetylase RimI [Thermomonospora echinospora]